MAGRNLSSFRGVEVGECIIVNHREVFASRLGVQALVALQAVTWSTPLSVDACRHQKLTDGHDAARTRGCVL
jgi:hypothetical protein